MNEVIVFAGPSISAAEIRAQLPQADVRPPIRRGDLAPTPGARYAIIDGLFFQSLAVSPQEIVAALRAGAEVWGAASMGALRAAECAPLGMKGVGAIFERFREGVWDSDDEVAVAVDPDSGKALSDSLADVRFFLESESLAPGVKESLLASLQQTYFPERSFARAAASLDPAITQRFAAAPKQKEKDARLLLETLRTLGHA